MKYLTFLCILSLALAGCKQNKGNTQDAQYQTMTVEASDCLLNSEFAAAISGKQYVEIRPQVSGTITRICINEGDLVKKGQLLFVIDQVPYKAALETAIANVKMAEAKLETAKLTADSKKELFNENVVSEFDLKTAQNAYLEAKAYLAQTKAEEVNARNNLSYTEVKSPVDGFASMIPYRVGALVSSSIAEPLVTVSDDSNVNVYFSMAENQILDILQQYGSLHKAIENLPEVSLKLSNGKEYNQKGRIDAISGTIDESTGAVSLRATFPNPDGLLRNGGSGTVLLPYERKGCIVIPQTATYEIQNKTFVFKVVDGYAKSTDIEVFHLNNGTEYIVESGLQPGEEIISEGAGLISDGTKVK